MTSRSGLHYERQEQGDMTCAVHTLNGLLQQPSFSVVDLGEIAMQLEGDEIALLGGKKKRNENVGMDGNFNVQVLQQALRAFDVELVFMSQLPQEQREALCQGYVVNRGGHWFAIRKVHGVWWNLNSLDPDCPSKMGGMYLDMFLSQLVGGGASVFAAMGPLPSPLPTTAAPALSNPAPPTHATAPSSFSGVGHSLKESSLQPAFPAHRIDDLNLAMAMSMISSGPSALKIAIVDPLGVRQVIQVNPRYPLIRFTQISA